MPEADVSAEALCEAFHKLFPRKRRTTPRGIHVLASMVLGAVALVLSVVFGSVVALSVVLVSIAMAGALAYDGPFWASASRAVPVVLAVSLLLGGLVMITLRRQADRPVVTPSAPRRVPGEVHAGR